MTLLRAVSSLLTCIAGMSVFVAFIILKNYPTAIFGFITGMLSGILSHIHLLNYKNTLRNWYSETHLVHLSRFGFWSFAFGIAILVYLIVIESMLKKPIFPIPESIILPIIWAAIMMKSGLVLSIYAKTYSTRIIDENSDRSNLIEERRQHQEATNDEESQGSNMS